MNAYYDLIKTIKSLNYQGDNTKYQFFKVYCRKVFRSNNSSITKTLKTLIKMEEY